MRFFIGVCVWAMVLGTQASAQEQVFVIRHAEKELTGDDPALTEAARDRAAGWARMLGAAGIGVVIHSDAARTRETGGLIAAALGLETAEVERSDTAGLVDLMAFDFESDRVLVVAHRETIPSIVRTLGVTATVDIADDVFDRLFLVGPDMAGGRTLVEFRMP